MKFYRINTGDNTEFAGTMDQAKAVVKSADPTYRVLITVDEVEMATDKDSLLALLNNDGQRPDGTSIFANTGRTWKGTSRGGLQEVGGEAKDGVL